MLPAAPPGTPRASKFAWSLPSEAAALSALPPWSATSRGDEPHEDADPFDALDAWHHAKRAQDRAHAVRIRAWDQPVRVTSELAEALGLEEERRKRQEDVDALLRARQEAEQRANLDRDSLLALLSQPLTSLLVRLGLYDKLSLPFSRIGILSLDALATLDWQAFVDGRKRQGAGMAVNGLADAVQAARRAAALARIDALTLASDRPWEAAAYYSASAASSSDGSAGCYGGRNRTEPTGGGGPFRGPLRSSIAVVVDRWFDYLEEEQIGLSDRLYLLPPPSSESERWPSWMETVSWALWMTQKRLGRHNLEASDSNLISRTRRVIDQSLALAEEYVWHTLYPAMRTSLTPGEWRLYWTRAKQRFEMCFADEVRVRLAKEAARRGGRAKGNTPPGTASTAVAISAECVSKRAYVERMVTAQRVAVVQQMQQQADGVQRCATVTTLGRTVNRSDDSTPPLSKHPRALPAKAQQAEVTSMTQAALPKGSKGMQPSSTIVVAAPLRGSRVPTSVRGGTCAAPVQKARQGRALPSAANTSDTPERPPPAPPEESDEDDDAAAGVITLRFSAPPEVILQKSKETSLASKTASHLAKAVCSGLVEEGKMKTKSPSLRAEREEKLTHAFETGAITGARLPELSAREIELILRKHLKGQSWATDVQSMLNAMQNRERERKEAVKAKAEADARARRSSQESRESLGHRRPPVSMEGRPESAMRDRHKQRERGDYISSTIAPQGSGSESALASGHQGVTIEPSGPDVASRSAAITTTTVLAAPVVHALPSTGGLFVSSNGGVFASSCPRNLAACSVPQPGQTRQGAVTLKGRQLKKEATVIRPSSEFVTIANEFRKKASVEDEQTNAGSFKKPLSVRLGNAFVQKKIKVNELVRAWAKNGDSPISKMEFRVHVRSILNKTDAKDIDALFERLDSDKGGTLDVEELKAALWKLQDASARAAKDQVARDARATFYRERAALADTAATCTGTWEQAREDLKVMQGSRSLAARLGALLTETKVKVPELIYKWDSSRDSEIDRVEFRQKIKEMHLANHADTEEGRIRFDMEIDALFDMLNVDHGDTLDASELKNGLKKLEQLATESEAKIREHIKHMNGTLAAAARVAQAELFKQLKADEAAGAAEDARRAREVEAKTAASSAANAAREAAASQKAADAAAEKVAFEAKVADRRARRPSVTALH